MNENETKPLTEQESIFEEFDIVKYNIDAGNGRRFLNYIIDLFFYYVFIIVLVLVLGFVFSVTGLDYESLMVFLDKSPLSYVFSFATAVVYYTSVEYLTNGRSIGKFLTKTKVVKYDGSAPTFRSYIIRSLCRFIPFEPFSFFRSEKTGWHDDYSKTRVVLLKE